MIFLESPFSHNFVVLLCWLASLIIAHCELFSTYIGIIISCHSNERDCRIICPLAFYTKFALQIYFSVINIM